MEIRRATPNDSPGLAKVQVDSYLATYSDIYPAAYLAHFTYDEQEQDWREWFRLNRYPFFVAITLGEVIGYGLGKPNADEVSPYESELVALHVRKEYQRQGLGRRLISAVSEGFLTQGYESLFLWVLKENPACGFYESLGGRLIGEKAWINNDYFGTKIDELAYGWLDIRNLLMSDE